MIDILEIKDFCRVRHDEDDGILADFADSVITIAESHLHFTIFKADYKMIIYNTSPKSVELGRKPINSIVSVSTISNSDEYNAVDSKLYYLKDDVLYFNNHIISPKIEIVFSAGRYEENNIPKDLKLALLNQIKHNYDGESDDLTPKKSKDIYNKYKIITI